MVCRRQFSVWPCAGSIRHKSSFEQNHEFHHHGLASKPGILLPHSSLSLYMRPLGLQRASPFLLALPCSVCYRAGPSVNRTRRPSPASQRSPTTIPVRLLPYSTFRGKSRWPSDDHCGGRSIQCIGVGISRPTPRKAFQLALFPSVC